MRDLNLQTNLLGLNIHEEPVTGSLLLPGKGATVAPSDEPSVNGTLQLKRNQINMAIISSAAGGAAIFLSGKWDAPVQHREQQRPPPQPLIPVSAVPALG